MTIRTPNDATIAMEAICPIGRRANAARGTWSIVRTQQWIGADVTRRSSPLSRS